MVEREGPGGGRDFSVERPEGAGTPPSDVITFTSVDSQEVRDILERITRETGKTVSEVVRNAIASGGELEGPLSSIPKRLPRPTDV